MRNVEEVLRLYSQGQSVREISRNMGMSRPTIVRYLKKAQEKEITWPLPDGMDGQALEQLLFPSADSSKKTPVVPSWSEMAIELQAHHHLTLQLCWRDYREQHPNGLIYSRFCSRYRTWKKKNEVVMHFEHRAGEKFFIDFAGDTVPIWDGRTGDIQFEAQIFVGVMGVSSLIFAMAFANQKVESWTTGGTKAFEYMGSVPICVVPDNPKPVVIKTSKYDPVFNQSYLEWARHYEVTIIPARPRKPRDKAAAEGGVLIVERQILARLRHSKFFSLYELNQAILDLLEDLNSQGFQKRDGSRKEVFETVDKPAMRPLPTTSYEYCEWKKLKVQMNYHVRIENGYYSVPYDLVGQKLDVRITQSAVEIFSKSVRVASHQRCQRNGQYKTISEHMPSSHQAQASWTPERILKWAETIGRSTQVVCEAIMATRYYPEHGFNQCRGIFHLASKVYTPERVEAACERAIAIHSPTYKSVVSILKNGLDMNPLTPPPVAPSIEHRNIRGTLYYKELLSKPEGQENVSC